MKYDLKAFNDSVMYYQKKLMKFKGKTIFVVIDGNDNEAFFSLAPFSRALHNLNCDVSVTVATEKAENIDALLEVWASYEEMEHKIKSSRAMLLKDFINEVDKKAKGEFKKIFRKPELFVYGVKQGLALSNGELLEKKTEWFKKYRWDELIVTALIVWRQVFNLKREEKVGIGFDLIRKSSEIKNPLEDYLDSYAIARTMYLACPARNKMMKSSTSKKTLLEKPERTSELSTTLLGCEIEKNISEPVFVKYKKLSKALKLERIKSNSATFMIKGEGYPGKHLFGEVIGYPTPNKKSRWEGPGGLIYQFPWYPQTKIDGRGPRCRLGFTDTLPIDIYIDSCKIDWMAMKKKNDALIALVNKSDKIFVESGKTKLEVGIIRPDGKRRMPMNSDVDTRDLIDKMYLKQKIKAGNMANIPGGEMFITPEYVKGRIYGDVVISIDKSYVLNDKNPLVIDCLGNDYKIISGPKEVIKKINEKKNEAMEVLLKQEKNKSLPQSIIDLKKKNFNNIGEFAINTNPKARLCDYLIVNEKIAGMMHIALGSGFEEDRASIYHYDIVINARDQKMNIYGVKYGKGKDGKEKEIKRYWMLKEGKLQVL
jgi:hypothetical protein